MSSCLFPRGARGVDASRPRRRASSASHDASEAAASSRGGALADETATALAHAWHPDALVASGAPGGEVDPDVADAAIELFADAFPRSALAIALRGGPPNAAPPPGPPEASSHATDEPAAAGKENASGAADSGAASASSAAAPESAAPESEGASDPEAKPKPPYPPPPDPPHDHFAKLLGLAAKSFRDESERSESERSESSLAADAAAAALDRFELVLRAVLVFFAGLVAENPPAERDRHPIATPMGSHLIRRCAVPGISGWNAYVQDQCSYLYDDVVRTVDHFIERRQIVRASAKMALAPEAEAEGLATVVIRLREPPGWPEVPVLVQKARREEAAKKAEEEAKKEEAKKEEAKEEEAKEEEAKKKAKEEARDGDAKEDPTTVSSSSGARRANEKAAPEEAASEEGASDDPSSSSDPLVPASSSDAASIKTTRLLPLEDPPPPREGCFLELGGASGHPDHLGRRAAPERTPEAYVLASLPAIRVAGFCRGKPTLALEGRVEVRCEKTGLRATVDFIRADAEVFPELYENAAAGGVFVSGSVFREGSSGDDECSESIVRLFLCAGDGVLRLRAPKKRASSDPSDPSDPSPPSLTPPPSSSFPVAAASTLNPSPPLHPPLRFANTRVANVAAAFSRPGSMRAFRFWRAVSDAIADADLGEPLETAKRRWIDDEIRGRDGGHRRERETYYAGRGKGGTRGRMRYEHAEMLADEPPEDEEPPLPRFWPGSKRRAEERRQEERARREREREQERSRREQEQEQERREE